MSLSIVTATRNDNYCCNSTKNFAYALKHNTDLLIKSKIDFDYTIVDWAPLSDDCCLYLNPELSSFFDFPFIKSIIVDNSIIQSENLSSGRFYEYFAKNVGLRRATKTYCMVLNHDILLEESTIAGIKEVLSDSENNTKQYFYRCQYRKNYLFDGNSLTLLENRDLDDNDYSDKCICGVYSGDFILLHKSNNIGYNETDSGHRTSSRQTGMDGEILWCLLGNGKKLKFVGGAYGHIEHRRPPDPKDCYREGIVYKNKENWGMIDYPLKKITDNVNIMSAM